jgi:hypothetical protein
MSIFSRVVFIRTGLVMLWPKPIVFVVALGVAALITGYKPISANYRA